MPKPNAGHLVIQCEEQRPRYINGHEIPNWQQGPSVWEAVNHLVQNGWLLLSGTSALWLDSGKITFIRSKQSLHLHCEEMRPRYMNGKEIPNWQQGPNVWEAVSYLVQNGWLLLSDPSELEFGYGDLTLIRSNQ